MREIAFVAVSAAVVLGGCNGSVAVESGSEDSYAQLAASYVADVPDFEQQVQRALSEARAGGANEFQIGLIELASTEGEVTLESARSANAATIQCFQAAGLTASVAETTHAGIPMPGYEVVAATDADYKIVEDCETANYYWISYLYQTQGATTERVLAYIEEQRETLRRCITGAGYEVANDATSLEMAFQALDIGRLSSDNPKCLREIGVDGL